MANIFIFWVGDFNQISENVRKIESLGHKVHIGPTKQEDEYLSRKYKYYRDSKKLKIYSFMSDVWRAYMLSNNEGFYIDAKVEVGKEVEKFYENNLSKYEAWIPRLRRNVCSFAVMYSNGKCDLFKKILAEFEKYDYINPRLFWIGPHVCDFILTSEGYYANSDQSSYEHNGILIDSPEKIFNKDYFVKTGDASWFHPRIKHENQSVISTPYTKICLDQWENNIYGRWLKFKSLPKADFERINFETEFASKGNLSLLKKIYKESYKGVGLKLTDRMIWRRLYRFFNFRKERG